MLFISVINNRCMENMKNEPTPQPAKTYRPKLIHVYTMRATYPSHRILPELTVLTILGEKHKLRRLLVRNFLQSFDISLTFLVQISSPITLFWGHAVA